LRLFFLFCLLFFTIWGCVSNHSNPVFKTQKPVPLKTIAQNNNFLSVPKKITSKKNIVKKPNPIECLLDLKAKGAIFIRWKSRKQTIKNSGTVCKVEKGVILYKGPMGLSFEAAKVSCTFALRLVRFEKVLMEEAKYAMGETAKRILNWGSYKCRNIGRFPDIASEHSFGNALDIGGVELKSGIKTTVLRHFHKRLSEKEPTPFSRFWENLTTRLIREKIFSVILTPNYDKIHNDHLHIDGAPYSLDGT
jgi:hypothetical protein